MAVPVKPAGMLATGDFVNWESKGKYYRVEGAHVIGGWAFVTMEGHPTKVCSIWHTVDMPWYR